MDMAESRRIDVRGGGVLRGRALRYLLVDLLMTHGQATVSDMVAALADAGHKLSGRPSKVISDALRWEVGHGRVIRVARGVYRLGRPSRSTARRMRILARRADAWLKATARGVTPDPYPHNPRSLLPRSPCTSRDPCSGKSPCSCGLIPPWTGLGWLWVL